MDAYRILRPFRFRLKLEAGLRAFFFAGCLTLTAGIALLVVKRAFPDQVVFLRSDLVLSCVLAIGFASGYFLRFRPSWKETGRRIDCLGLEERMTTYVEYEQSDSVMCAVQRQDALEKLREVAPGQLKLDWPVREMAACLFLLALLALVGVIPESAWSWMQRNETEAAVAESAELKQVREQLEAIAAMIDEADLPIEEKALLYARIRAIEDKIRTDGEMDLLVLADVMQETEKLLEEVGALEKLSPIVGELRNAEMLKPLAEAISARSEQSIQDALRELQKVFLSEEGEGRTELLNDAAQEIETALSNVPGGMTATLSTDYLCFCFRCFAGELRTIAQAVSVGVDGEAEIKGAIQTMRNRLVLMLSAEKNSEAGLNIEDGSALEEEGRGTMKLFGQATGGASGMLDEGQLKQMMLDGEISAEALEQERFAQSEAVYEPTMDARLAQGEYIPGKRNRDGSVQREVVEADSALYGTIAYEKVYGMYFADVLNRLPDLPAEEREQLENYYYGLIHGSESRTQDE